MDRISKERRSENMGRIRSRDTRPELAVRRALRELGLGYRLHRRDLPGSPDIVMARRRIAMFVHGCFWHQHPGCKRAFTPNSRPEYWGLKLGRNVTRDSEVRARLEELGWQVAVIWECETRSEDDLRRMLAEAVGVTSDTGGQGDQRT